MNWRRTGSGGAVAVKAYAIDPTPQPLTQDNTPRRQAIAASAGRAEWCRARQVMVINHLGHSGIPMTVKMPVNRYRGVAVDIAMSAEGAVESARVVLAHADTGMEVVLFTASDDRDIVAEWRCWARDMNLPMLLRTADGDIPAHNQLGSVVLGATTVRRMPSMTAKRRPRILRRRKPGSRAPQQVHAGERVIISYE